MILAPSAFSANGEHGLPCARDIMFRVQVHVDGDMLRAVVAYSVDEGWCEVVERDDAGKFRSCGGEWIIRRVLGKVKAVLV